MIANALCICTRAELAVNTHDSEFAVRIHEGELAANLHDSERAANTHDSELATTIHCDSTACKCNVFSIQPSLTFVTCQRLTGRRVYTRISNASCLYMRAARRNVSREAEYLW